MEDLEKEIDAQDEDFVGPKYIYPNKGRDDSHHSYDGPHDHHDSHHHDHDSYGPNHDSHGSDRDPYGPDHDGYEPRHKSSYSYQGKSDDACVQETRRSECQTAATSDIKYM